MIEQLKSDRLTADFSGYEVREGTILVALMEGERKSATSSLVIPQKSSENEWGKVVISSDPFTPVGTEVLIPKKPMQRWTLEGEVCVMLYATDLRLKRGSSK